MIDIKATSWQRSARRLIDDRFAGGLLSAADHRAIEVHLSELVASCQRSGAVRSMIRIAPLDDGGLSTAGLHIAWFDSTPEPASLAIVRRALPRDGLIEEHSTPNGDVLLHRQSQTSSVPGREGRVGLITLQAFVPVPQQNWTAVVSTASAHPETTELLESTVLSVAASFEIWP